MSESTLASSAVMVGSLSIAILTVTYSLTTAATAVWVHVGECSPSEVHCATHERQPICNPMPKTQTRRPKTATQGLPKWWRSPDWVDMVTVTHANRVTPNIYQPIPKLQSRRQSDYGLQP